jgi:hypothetical protein
MHFWNKLSIAAMMRLTILASMNLIMGRVVGNWETMLHPLFFLSILTIDLGLYALMVYSGTLNKTLIGMMLGGLAGVLGLVASHPASFGYDSPLWEVSLRVESLIDAVIRRLSSTSPPVPFRFPWQWATAAGCITVDLAGLILIAAGGITARVLQASSPGRDTPAPRPSS